jgi:leucyl/phenylalanyl-tRNA---protein transferase
VRAAELRLEPRELQVTAIASSGTRWRFPNDFVDHPSDLITLGADLEPGTLLAAYAQGLFPMPWENDTSAFSIPAHPVQRKTEHNSALGWWSPDPRGVILAELWEPNRSMRRARRKYRITVDEAFDDVVAGCGNPERPHGWITPEIHAAYAQLHKLGWAHSVEARDEEGRLVGGLYGVAIGGFFAAESKFHRATDGSKAALAGLCEICGPEALIDVQWATPHLMRLGVLEIGRAEYLERLAEASQRPLPEGFTRNLKSVG